MGAIVQSSGALASTHREAFRTSAPRSSVLLYGGRMHSYAELYRQQPNLRLVIRFLARNIAQLGLKAYRRTSATERVELESSHPLARFLKNPTPSLPVPTSRHAWIRGIVNDLALYDSLVLLKMRNTSSGDLNAVRLPPAKCEPVGDSWLWPEAMRFLGTRDQPVYPIESLVYFHGDDPEDPRVGSSPVEALRQILAEEEAAGVYREQHWRNAARMNGVIERPKEAGKWSDTARQRFASDWRSAWTGAGGSDAGGTPILEDGMSFKEASFSAKDSEYLGARKLAREEVASAYFIPPVFVGILENANFSNVKEQHVSLYSDTLGPWLDWITEELELQLVPEFPDVEDVYLEFNIEAKLAGRFEEQAAAIQTATGAPWLSRNEARALRNLPPIAGGDELVVPLNVLIGGQASPTDSAPPATGAVSRTSSSGAKARNGELARNLEGWKAKHEEVLSGFFAHQRESTLSKLGAGQSLADAWTAGGWDEKLAADLLALSHTMTDELGSAVAERFGGEWDLGRTEAWLTENARIAAEQINASTYSKLSEAWSGVPRTGFNARKSIEDALDELGLDLAPDELDDVLSGDTFTAPARNVFETVIAGVGVLAATRATLVGQWARREGASQAGVRYKVWISSGAANSRHGAYDGETVPLGEPFSNGGQYPGDPALGVDETAGCLCSLDFTNSAD